MAKDNFKGFGESSGMGERPAILVIDFMKGFTNPESALGANLDKELNTTKTLLNAARKKTVPVIFTTVAFDPSYRDGAHFIQKIPALKSLVIGGEGSEIDSHLERNADSELLIVKKFASAFFGTNLSSVLTYDKIDTLILVGCSTSGCVRATAVDGIQHGYRIVVPEDCVGDRSQDAHQSNLYDIQTKYGDVVHSNVVVDYLENLKVFN